MDLWVVLNILKKRWVLILIGAAAGVVLAFVSLFSVVIGGTAAGSGLRVERRSLSVYTQTVAVVVDLPGFGLGRTDVAMAKPVQMAPTFAYLATSNEVLGRVEKITGPLRERVVVRALPVEDSPLVQITVEGQDRELVAKAAEAFAQAVCDSVSQRQDDNKIPAEQRLVLRPLGSSSPPVEVRSRAIEVAAILLLLPIAAAIGVAFAVENVQRSMEGGRGQEAGARKERSASRLVTAEKVATTPAKRHDRGPEPVAKRRRPGPGGTLP
jgi:capsular polysaccharide biosynthesis protein